MEVIIFLYMLKMCFLYEFKVVKDVCDCILELFSDSMLDEVSIIWVKRII